MKNQGPFKRLLHVFPKKGLLIFGIIIAIVTAVFSVGMSLLIREVIDAAVNLERDRFFLFAYIGGGSVVFMIILTYTRSRLIGHYTEGGIANLRLLLSKKIMHLSFPALEDNTSGDLLSRGTNDLNRVRNYTSRILPRLIEVPLSAILALGVLLYLSWQLTLLSLLMVPILIIGAGLLMKPIRPASKRVQEKLGEVNTIATDFIKGVEVAKAYTLEDTLQDKNNSSVDQSIESGLVLAKRRAILETFSMGFSIIPFITTFLIGGYFVINGNLSLGGLLAFINLLNFLTFPLSQLSVILGDAKRDLAAAERIFETLDQEEERVTGEVHSMRKDRPLIEFKHVTFRYNDDSQPAINDFNLVIHDNEAIAFVGPSGGGKSTITKLLMGYYHSYEGEINIGGHDIKSWNLNALRDKLSLVSQDTFLFPETIKENIRNGDLTANDTEIVHAAKQANADEFIVKYEKGYNTHLGELGDSLSGGQKQRISIARAIIKDAPILLLDEATSALDTESEARIQEALARILKTKTSIVIAHRLSTIKEATTIHVIDQGTIIESGTHTTLLEQKGLYHKLYQESLNKKEGLYEVE
jgi:ABC-type multidrug transport system fused ATPase/permease subunit